MPIFEVYYYPPAGQNHSPVDVLHNPKIIQSSDAINIENHINALASLPRMGWPPKWVKPVKGLDQLTVGNFRVYILLDGKRLVIYYICRKTSQKAKDTDLNHARNNLQDYYDNKKGQNP